MENRQTLMKKGIALGMAAWFLLAPLGGEASAATSPAPASPKEAAAEQSQKPKMPQDIDVERRKDTGLSTEAIVAALVTIALGILAVSASSDNR